MATLANLWADRIRAALKKEDKWRTLGRKIVKRYRDEAGNPKEAKFNVLYANTSVLQPALFSQLPRPDVRRTHSDQPTAEQLGAEAIERCLHYYRDDVGFTRAIRLARDDMILPGWGVARVKYEAEFNKIGITKTEAEIDETTGEVLVPERFVDEFGNERDPDGDEIKAGEIEEKYSERCWVEYVYWEDFTCADVRNWEDVWWVAFRNVLSPGEAKDLFGEEKAELLQPPQKKADASKESTDKEFEVWEVWDKRTRKRFWVSLGSGDFFEEEDDPYGLKGFFPCPKPLYSIETSDTMIPVPPYVQYESQAVGLDLNTKRQASISKAMKMVGIYAGSEGKILKLLQEAEDGTVVPVEEMDQKLRDSIEWLPIQEGAAALQQLMFRSNDLEKKVFQISGVADIMRGDTREREPNKTQELKLSSASLRLRPLRERVEEFIKELYRIKAEIIAEKYSPETITKISGMEIPLPVFQFLANQEMRNFKIDIETDSTVQPDAQLEKKEMAEFAGALAPMLQQIYAIGQQSPQAVPALLKIMTSFLRTFKIDPKIEAELDKLAQEALKLAAQPKGPTDTQIKEAAATERVKISTEGKIKEALIKAKTAVGESTKDREMEVLRIALESLSKDEDRDAASL